MRVGDEQQGAPQTLYRNERVYIDSYPSPEQGMLAYATDTQELLMYNGVSWSNVTSVTGKLVKEDITGQIPSPSYYTSYVFEPNTLQVFWNGLLQSQNDFQVDYAYQPSSFSLNFNPQYGDTLEVVYQETSGLPYKTTGGRTYVDNLTDQTVAGNYQFYTNNSFYPGSLAVYKNGLLQKPTDDWQPTDDQHGFTMTVGVREGEEILAVYQGGNALYDPDDADTLDGLHASSFVKTSDYTAADVLAKIKTVDGAGSGLDADTVDGIQANKLVALDGSNNVALPNDLTISGLFRGGLPGATFSRSTALSTTSGVWTAVTWTSVGRDTGGYWNAANPTRMTIPENGYYLIIAYMFFDYNATGMRAGMIAKNTGTNNPMTYGTMMPVTTSAYTTALILADIRVLSAGDYLELYGFQNSGGALNISAANASTVNHMVILKVA